MRAPSAIALSLGQDDGWVDRSAAGIGAEAAVGPGQDALAPDDVGETADALRDQHGMLDEVVRRVDHAGHQHLVVRDFAAFHSSHSCSWRGLAPSNSRACGRALASNPISFDTAMSCVCGPA